MKFRLLQAAEHEVAEQVAWYDEQLPGLGARFLNAVEDSITRACNLPDLGSPYLHGTRRVFPRDFPYSVAYRVDSEGIVIVAVAAFARKPGYWGGRR